MSMIHSLLEDYVKHDGGPAQLAAVRAIMSEQRAAKDSVAQAEAFVDALAQARNARLGDLYRTVGTGLVAPLLRALPILIRANKTTLSVLMHINQVAPATLDALLPDAVAPDFDVELSGPDSLRLRFVAGDHAAAAIEGVILGVATHFGERAECTWHTPTSSLPDRRVLEVTIKALKVAHPTPINGLSDRKGPSRNGGAR
jgi:hypothetical protein